MSNRIIQNGGGTPVPEPPASMNDLIDRAQNAYLFKRKDESIKLICAALRLMSQGVAQCLKDIDAIKTGMADIVTDLDEIKKGMEKDKE